MDFNSVMKAQQAWRTFSANHPKFPAFLNAIKSRGIHEGDVIAITVTSPEGSVIENNIRITASDMELFESLKDIR